MRAEHAFAAAREHGALPPAALAIALRLRARQSADPESFDRAVAASRQVVEADPGSPALLILGNALLGRFAASQRRADLDEAIRFYERATDTVAADDRNRPLTLNNLAAALLKRAELADVDTAIARLDEALLGPVPGIAYARLDMLQNLSRASKCAVS